MDHQQATQRTAVEKYLLDELTGEERDQFEEHFFDCQECATDLRATAGFMAAAKNEFKANPVPKLGSVRKGKSFFASFSPVLAWSALAACLLVIAYQYAGRLSALQERDFTVDGSRDSAHCLPGWRQQPRGPGSGGYVRGVARFSVAG